MREINNNTAQTNNVNFQGIKPAVKPEEVPVVDVEAKKESTDLGKMPAEVIGRSQVAQTHLEKDVVAFLANPKAIETSMEFFDKMEAMGYAPEQAAALMGKFAEEFSK